MGIIWLDSFDWYSSASTNGYTAGTIVSDGRWGTQGIRSADWDSAGGLRVLPKTCPDITIGFAVKWSQWTDSNNGFVQLQWNFSEEISLRTTTTGTLYVYSPLSGQLGAASENGVLPTNPNVWHYMELQVHQDQSAGSVKVRLDGREIINNSGVDTIWQGYITRFLLNGVANRAGLLTYDDLYICDGITESDFLGDIRVEALSPSGNGNSSQWVGSDADQTDNYALVDETGTISDADYVGTATSGYKDTYAFGNLATTTGTVAGTMVNYRAQKTDTGSRVMVPVARSGTNETDGDAVYLANGFGRYAHVYGTKPGGGVWTISDVNSAEFGVKVTG